MESVKLLGLSDESRDPTDQVPKLATLVAPRRIPAGTIAPPVELEPDDLVRHEDGDLEALRAQARVQESTHAWGELTQTLRRIIDVGSWKTTI